MNPPFPIRYFVGAIFLALLVQCPLSAAPAAPATYAAALNQQLVDDAARGKLDAVTLDVYRGADVNAVDRYRRTPLTACAAGEGPEATRLNIIKLLVGSGADVNQHSVFQPTSLLIAIDYRQTQIANYLLDSGADPTSFDSLGDCALTHAARTGQIDMVRALIAKGADARATDHRGRTPLMWVSGPPTSAPDYSQIDEVMPSESGYTVIRCMHNRPADLPGGEGIVQALVAANADVDASDNDGNTALMIAASEGKLEVVRALIVARADWRKRNDLSDTALMCAEKAGDEDTVDYLKSIGGAKDPIYLALEKRIENAKQARDRDIAAVCNRPVAAPQSDPPGLTLQVFADRQFVPEGKMPVLHYVLENRTDSPITVISPADASPDAPTSVKAGWSMALIDKSRVDHPQPPDFPTLTPSGSTISALATIDVITVPANGHVELPITASLSPVIGATPSLYAPGIYRAAFYYISDPNNLPYATDDVHTIANGTTACRLVSNEITIVNE